MDNVNVKKTWFRQERLEILQDIGDAEKQLAEGNGIAHKTARMQVLKSLAQNFPCRRRGRDNLYE
ncbi:MAG TPA: hypothetical protein VFP95_03345 [Gammaproteobacteria bacterium]|nr:hypothetical protein [Gammaproteobacteria bacterium]